VECQRGPFFASADTSYSTSTDKCQRLHTHAHTHTHTHIRTQTHTHRATLFLPGTTPHEYYEKYYEKGAQGAVKLYVRRVFITDDTGEDLLPRWLGFLRGIVDSDTLPLNVRVLSVLIVCLLFCILRASLCPVAVRCWSQALLYLSSDKCEGGAAGGVLVTGGQGGFSKSLGMSCKHRGGVLQLARDGFM